MIDTPGGGQVRLDDVADVSVEPVPNVVHHEELLRNIDVGASMDGSRDLGSVVRDIDRILEDDVQWPLEFRAEMLGEYTERQAAQQRLLLLAIVAAAVIFLLLQAAFRSWRLAALASRDATDRPGRRTYSPHSSSGG